MKTIHLISLLAIAAPLAVVAAPDFEKASAKIDALIAAGYDEHEIEPNRRTDDATFVRRAHLDIIGRIPTADEAGEFIASDDPAKRRQLIDRLLDSPGYVSHQFNFWADILRITTRMSGQSPENGIAYGNWVKSALRDNMPFDRFVSELITAEGMIDENGAVGFYLRDRGMEIDHLATTVQTFLGTQMVCAQCHDHPFDDWTQMDYYELAAFSTPVTVVRNPDSVDEAMQMANRQAREKQKRQRECAVAAAKVKGEKAGRMKPDNALRNETRNTMRGLNTLTVNFRNSVVGETGRTLKLPHDYQYDDAQPEQVVHAGTPFGELPALGEEQSRVAAYADWMTSPENPRFTKTIANRLWKRVLGVGLFEPIDDIKDTTTPTNPALLAYLEELMIELDYDLKAFYRVLYSTDTYGREAQSFDMLSGEKYYYPGPRLRRMSAEQVWDSMVALMRADVDSAKGPGAGKYSVGSSRLKAWQTLEKQPPAALLKRQAEVVKFTKDSEAKMDQFREQVDKVVTAEDGEAALRLGREIMNYNVEATFEYARLTYWEVSALKSGYFRTPFRRTPSLLYRELVAAFPENDFPDEKGMYAGMEDKGALAMESPAAKKAEQKKLREEMGKAKYAEYQRERGSQQRMKNFVRASELPSPAPDGHFLRVFGQSDRALIENANLAASVPQALALMNGPTFNTLMDRYSVLSKQLATADDSDALLEAVYLNMLSREPTDEERALLRDEVAAAGKGAARSLVWTLLNTQQFLFIQ